MQRGYCSIGMKSRLGRLVDAGVRDRQRRVNCGHDGGSMGKFAHLQTITAFTIMLTTTFYNIIRVVCGGMGCMLMRILAGAIEPGRHTLQGNECNRQYQQAADQTVVQQSRYSHVPCAPGRELYKMLGMRIDPSVTCSP